MKHTLKVTLILALLFLIAQIIGLAVTNEYIDHKTTTATGNVTWEALPYNVERPQVEQSTSYIWIIFAVIIGTLIFLLLIKYKVYKIWKLWFFIAVWFALTIAFAAFLPQLVAAILGFIFALLKIFKPATIIHNLAEIFIYGGLAAIFVPIVNVFAAFMLLIFISVYDVIAVWKTKHMIKLAKFQASSKIFAGLLIPYGKAKAELKAEIPLKIKAEKKKVMVAVLGGGDIGFPLIFAGVVMKDLMLKNMEIIGFFKTLIIPFFVTIALLFLLIKGRKDKFYPAMPFLSIGCFIGYLVILFI